MLPSVLSSMFPWRNQAVEPAPPPFVSGSVVMLGCQCWVLLLTFLLLVHGLCYALILRLSKDSKLGVLRRDPMLAAHFLPQLFAFLLSVYSGAGDWMFRMEPTASGAAIGAHVPQGERIAWIMIGFQVYEFLTCCASPRLRGAANELVLHHVVAILLAVLAYYYQAFQFFCPAFMGMAEMSSLPLAVVDLFKQYPELRRHFPNTNEIARNAFAVSFLALRGAYWPLCSYRFCMTTAAALATGSVLPFPMWVVYIFVAGNVLMTVLQWYWSSLIVHAIYLKVIGDPRHKES